MMMMGTKPGTDPRNAKKNSNCSLQCEEQLFNSGKTAPKMIKMCKHLNKADNFVKMGGTFDSSQCFE